MSKRTVTIPLHEYEAMKHRNDDVSKDLKERLNIMEQELSSVLTGAYATAARWGRHGTIQQYVKSLEKTISEHNMYHTQNDIGYFTFLVKDFLNHPLVKLVIFFSSYLKRASERIQKIILNLNGSYNLPNE